MRFFLTSFLLLLIAGPALASTDTPCPGAPEKIDQCFRASGRISHEPGARPSIWLPKRDATFPIASTVSQSPEEYDWPQNVEAMATPGNDVWGNYVICPQTDPDEPELSTVCIRTGMRLHSIE